MSFEIGSKSALLSALKRRYCFDTGRYRVILLALIDYVKIFMIQGVRGSEGIQKHLATWCRREDLNSLIKTQ